MLNSSTAIVDWTLCSRQTTVEAVVAAAGKVVEVLVVMIICQQASAGSRPSSDTHNN